MGEGLGCGKVPSKWDHRPKIRETDGPVIVILLIQLWVGAGSHTKKKRNFCRGGEGEKKK